MAEVSAEAHIEAPAEKVWAQLVDWSAYRKWNATHTGFPQGSPKSLVVGGTFQENLKLMDFPAEVEWTIAELEPARVLAIRGKGPMTVDLTTRYTLTPDGTATTVRIDGAAVSTDGGQTEGLGDGRAERVAAETGRTGDAGRRRTGVRPPHHQDPREPSHPHARGRPADHVRGMPPCPATGLPAVSPRRRGSGTASCGPR